MMFGSSYTKFKSSTTASRRNLASVFFRSDKPTVVAFGTLRAIEHIGGAPTLEADAGWTMTGSFEATMQTLSCTNVATVNMI